MTNLEFYSQACGSDTIEHFVNAVLRIDNVDDATKFYFGCVDYVQQQIDEGVWESSSNAIESTEANIGWCFGEGMSQDRMKMWRKVSNTIAHPLWPVIVGGEVE
jgi:hypothetical protein